MVVVGRMGLIAAVVLEVVVGTVLDRMEEQASERGKNTATPHCKAKPINTPAAYKIWMMMFSWEAWTCALNRAMLS